MTFLLIFKHILAKASELLATVETKAAGAASAIAAKTVEAKNTTVAAAHSAASTIQGKIYYRIIF